MSERPIQTVVEIRISSVGTLSTDRIPAVRWSEIWGIRLHAGQPFLITEDQLRLPNPAVPPKKVCMLSLEAGRLHCTIIDRHRDAKFNLEAMSEAICRMGDRILIGDTTLIEILRAPNLAEPPTAPDTFENGLEKIFHSLEDALSRASPLEETSTAIPTGGPARSVFVDLRGVEVALPAEVSPPANPARAAGSAALRSFADIPAVPLSAHRPDLFLRPTAGGSHRPHATPLERRRPMPVRRRNRVSRLLLALLGIALALWASER